MYLYTRTDRDSITRSLSPFDHLTLRGRALSVSLSDRGWWVGGGGSGVVWSRYLRPLTPFRFFPDAKYARKLGNRGGRRLNSPTIATQPAIDEASPAVSNPSTLSPLLVSPVPVWSVLSYRILSGLGRPRDCHRYTAVVASPSL